MTGALWSIRQKIKELFASEEEKRHALVGPSRLWKMKRQFQIDYLKSVGLKPESFLLDIGCGTLRGGVPLIEYLESGHYHGVERRAEVLEEGKKELEKNGLSGKSPVLRAVEDLSTESFGRKFDFIWAFSVLIHLEDDILFGCLDFVSRHLEEGGSFYANVKLGVGNEGKWEEFPVVWRTLEFYQENAARYGMNVEELATLKELGHVSGEELQDTQNMLRFCLKK